jgi:hypothetical protein
VAAEKRRFSPPPEQQRRLVESFFGALANGDVDSLRSMLAADVGDACGSVSARNSAPASCRPSIIRRRDGAITTIPLFDSDGERITELVSVVDPTSWRSRRTSSTLGAERAHALLTPCGSSEGHDFPSRA